MDQKAGPKPFLIAALVLLLILVGFLVGFWARDSGPFASDDEDGLEVHTAARNDDYTFSLGTLVKDHSIAIELHALENGRFDVLLMDSTNYEAYKGGGPFDYIEAGSGLNVANFTTSLEVDRSENYYWVIDNTSRPVDGAQPLGDISFKGKVEK